MTNGDGGYEPRRSPSFRRLSIRGLDYHITCWGDAEAAPVFLLHGFMDTGTSFQFLADAMADDWFLIAPDWRGFGKTQWSAGGYWFPDYLADLDALLNVLSPGEPVNLVGHSMGGNVACLYAGVRPDRVRRLVSLEGFGLAASSPDQAPERYRVWIEQQQHRRDSAVYQSFEHLAERLCARNPRLTQSRAAFLARSWGVAKPDGGVGLRADPLHRLPNPVLYRREEAEACWRRVTAPVLFVSGAESGYINMAGTRSAAEGRRYFTDFESITIPDAGHMLHHDCPEVLAGHITSFLAG